MGNMEKSISSDLDSSIVKSGIPKGYTPFDKKSEPINPLLYGGLGFIAYKVLNREPITRRDALVGIGTAGAVGAIGCKKHSSIEEPIEEMDPTFVGGYNNITRSGATGMEQNDHVSFSVTGEVSKVSQSDRFTKFDVGLYKGDVLMEAIASADVFPDSHEFTFNATTQLGNPSLGDLDIKVSYAIQRANGETRVGRGIAGSVSVDAEQDYSWGTEKNQKIYDNRDAIAGILDRNAKFNGEDQKYDDIVKGLKMWYNPQTGMAKGTELQDTSVANSFKIVANNNVYLTGLSEKEVYEIRKIIE